jgi:protein SCO1/2
MTWRPSSGLRPLSPRCQRGEGLSPWVSREPLSASVRRVSLSLNVSRVPLAPRERGEGGAKRRVRGALAAIVFLALPLIAGETTNTAPKLPGNVSIAQKLNTQIPLDLMFRDELGRIVRLRQFFGAKPVLLDFVYYRCPMLCPIVLDGTTEALTNLKYDIGKEYDVITVSIDPRDKPEDAARMKEKYIKRYGRLDSANGWHFLTANETAIRQLADAVGFQFAYDPKMDQFAHGAALLVLTPDGRTSRYFYGFEYKPRDLRLAIYEAGEGKIGGLTDQLLLLCFHYDPKIGKYSRDAMIFARAGGVTTMLALGGFIFVMIRKERMAEGRAQSAAASLPPSEPPPSAVCPPPSDSETRS